MRIAAALLLLPALAGAQGAGWERLLPGLAPALRACLDGRDGAMVVDAWEEGGATVARVQATGGAREDCVVSGGAVVSRRAVPAAERRVGEGLRAFMTERRCVDARRVVDATGREAGWLAYPACG